MVANHLCLQHNNVFISYNDGKQRGDDGRGASGGERVEGRREGKVEGIGKET